MDVFPKFIIEGDCLIIAKVTYHSQLVDDHKLVKGGGWFKYRGNDEIILYGDSFDYGAAKIEDIKKCIENGMVYTDQYQTRNITNDFQFFYNTGTELIHLTPNNPQ